VNENQNDLTDLTSEANLSRRSLLRRLLGVGVVGWLGTIFYPIAKYLVPPPVGESTVTSMKIGPADEEWPEPFKIIQFGRKPVIVLKDQQGNYRALSALCTHLACIVQYRSADNFIWCACHNGRFDLTGKVIAGPPPASLETYDVNITDDGEIWVSQRQV
jgi:Rieske Fe-S protein